MKTTHEPALDCSAPMHFLSTYRDWASMDTAEAYSLDSRDLLPCGYHRHYDHRGQKFSIAPARYRQGLY